MKFERMRLPVLTGMDAIEKYNPKETIYLSSVRTGIPCLIMNGKVCNTNGVPFKNDLFQDEFKEFAKRANDCKTIIIGRVIDISIPYKNYSIYDLGDIQRITYNSAVFARIKASIKIEVEDLYSMPIPGMEYKSRYLFLKNMVMSIFATDKKTNIELQPNVILETYSKADVNKFILTAADRGENVLFRTETNIYSQGDVKLNEARSFYLNPFKEFTGAIESITFDLQKPVEIEEEQNHIKLIKVNSNGNLATVDYTRSKLSQRRLLYKLIVGKTMKAIRFEAVLFDNLLQYARPL